MLDELRLPLLDDQDGALSGAEFPDFVGHQRISDVEDIDRDLRIAIGVGQARHLQHPVERVEEAALDDDPDLPAGSPEPLVQALLPDEGDRRGPAVLDLLDLVREIRRRKDDPADVADRALGRFPDGHRRAPVVARNEGAGLVASPDPELEHDRRVRRFRKLERFLDQVDEKPVVGPWIEQPHLRLHRESVGPLLHDRGALAIILADDDESAALDAPGRDVRKRIGRDIGPDHGFPGDRASKRIIDRSGKHRRGRRLACARLEMDSELEHQCVGVGEHVHQVRDRRSLVAADISDPGLKESLGDGENPLALEQLAFPEPELLDLLPEGAFGQRISPPRRRGPGAGFPSRLRS